MIYKGREEGLRAFILDEVENGAGESDTVKG